MLSRLPTLGFLSSLALSVLLTACGKPTSSSDETPNSADQQPDTLVTPKPGTIGEGGNTTPILTTPIVSRPVPLKALRERSANEFCQGLSDFFQNFAATKAPTSSLSLIKEGGSTCRVDSESQNLGFHSSVLFAKNGSYLRLAINLVVSMQGDVFTGSQVFIDRIGPKVRTFSVESNDQFFGDFSSLRLDLTSYTNLRSEDFRIFGLLASDAYSRIRTHFSPGKNKAWIDNPLLRFELSGSSLRITELANTYFANGGSAKTYLRCQDISCLQAGLSYEFKGLDIVLYSKPYTGVGNVTMKENIRYPITAAVLQN